MKPASMINRMQSVENSALQSVPNPEVELAIVILLWLSKLADNL